MPKNILCPFCSSERTRVRRAEKESFRGKIILYMLCRKCGALFREELESKK